MTVSITGVYQRRLEELEVPRELARGLRRADDFIRLAAVAASELTRPESEAGVCEGDSCGLVLGSGYGTMQTNFEVLDSVVFGQPTSPTLFSHSVFNAAAGYVASLCNLRGCALTVTDFSFPFFRALREGWLALLSGRVDCCLVLQVETYSQLLGDAREKQLQDSVDWQPGVVCWLLEKGVKGGWQLDCPGIEDKAATPFGYLQFREQLTVNGEKRQTVDPLGAAMGVGHQLLSGRGLGRLACRIEGPGGEVLLQCDWYDRG